MSDAVCMGGDGSQCCFMNECISSASMGCSGKRIDFYRYLNKLEKIDKK